MKKLYIFPLVGAILTLFGLCFPVAFLNDGVTIWLWGFHIVEYESLEDFRITYEKEFETFLRSILFLSFLFLGLILFSLISIIRTSIQMKKRQIFLIEAKTIWASKSISLITSLIFYMIGITMEAKDINYKSGALIQFLGGFLCLIPTFSRLKKRTFKINKYLTLKLKNDETIIYIAGESFELCKHLIISIPVGQIKNIDSIDEVVDGYGQNIEKKYYAHQVELTHKEIFRGHCSNLQVWAENGYDTRLLGSNLAFPLLKRLTEVGDLKASSVFKDEIRKRFKSLYAPVQKYLIFEGYLTFFSKSEKQELSEYVLNVDTWDLVGKNYFLQSQPEEAIKAYEHALKIDPINKTFLKRLCKLNVIVEDYQKAFKYYKILSEFYGLRNHDYLTLGDIYNDLCQSNNARRMYRRILQRKEFKCKRDALLKLGDLFFSELEIDRAKMRYWEAIESNPSDVRAWIRLSDIFQWEYKINAAVETLKEGLKYRSHNTILLSQLRLLYKTDRDFWEYLKISIIYLIFKNKKRIINVFKKEELISNLPRRPYTCGRKKKKHFNFVATKEKILNYCCES